MKLIQEIESYQPINEQEEKDKELILWFLKSNPDAFDRNNTLAHMTASCWIMNERRDKVLLCYHKIYQSWSWLGGHADGKENLLEVALTEAKEESGLTSVRPYTEEILSLESLTVNGHVKKGKFVSSHLHLNVTYLFVADDKEPLQVKEDENTGLRWFSLDEAVSASSEPWFKEYIYPKLNEKIRKLK